MRDVRAVPVVPPLGTALHDLISLGAKAGAFTRMDSRRLHDLHAVQVAKGLASEQTLEIGDGRSLRIVHQPMPGGGWVTTYEDMTARVQAEAKITHMARHDTLTGLPNRAALRELLDLTVAGLSRGDTFAVLFIDLDHFKAVNDALGFPAGDKVLREVADRMLGCLRKTERVARLDGDEFAVMVTGLQRPEDAGDVARRIADAVCAPYDINGAQVAIGTSIGIVMAPEDGASSDALLRKADLALDRAKLDGRNTIRYFERDMDARLQARRAIEIDLRKGLPRHEFELFYQPLLDLWQDRICGFEALLRWNHPAGRVSPADFIPVAQDTGLIVAIGEWVLIKACHQAVTWPDGVKVAVSPSISFHAFG